MTAKVTTPEGRTVLVTGAAGYLGRLVVQRLSEAPGIARAVVATDLRTPDAMPASVLAEALDVTNQAAVDACVARHRPDAIVHLAAIVTPPRTPDARAIAHKVDVDGTRHVLEACLTHKVGQIIVTSSGAAYGYHADNAPRLDEEAPLRGNEVFAYAHHKRLVEQMLAEWRRDHPEVKQLIFRPGTILGATTKNQITAIFERPVVVGVKGSATPFVFIWDEDVASCILQGIAEDKDGIYNLAGDGVMTLREIAKAMHRPYIALPPAALRMGLGVLERFHIGPYGPEQVLFLQHRPVLANDRLKRDLGFRPRSTRDVFALYQGRPHSA